MKYHMATLTDSTVLSYWHSCNLWKQCFKINKNIYILNFVNYKN